MFRITEDPSSGSLLQCLAKNYKNDSIVSVDMEKVGVITAYSDPLCVCVVHTRTTTSLYVMRWCGSMLPHHRITYNDVVFTES